MLQPDLFAPPARPPSPRSRQAQQIAAHLIAHGSITPGEALRLYHCMRLAARVKDLRDQGMRIKTEMVVDGEYRFARYHRLIGRDDDGRIR